MNAEKLRELKTLASVCPELNMANYTEDDVRHLNDWAIEMSLLVEQYTLSQQPAQATQAEVTDEQIKMLIPCGDAWKYEVGFPEAIQFARAILALRPERVQMTPASRDVIMATRTANADADEWPEPWAYQRGWNDAEAHHVITAQAKEAEAQQPATGEPVAWPLRARVWKRESTQEWVLEIAGTLGDTDMNIRHTQPLSVAYENVPGLPAFYTHPASSVLADVVRDAERYRWLRDNGVLGFSGAPSWRVSVSFDAMDAYAQTLDSNIDAAMLAAK